MIRALLGQYKPTAKVTGQTLVLSLPDAITPSVWTLDLTKDGHGSLKIEENADSGTTVLKYGATKKGAAEIEVAHYIRRADALRALITATEALEKSPPAAGISEGNPAMAHYAYAQQNQNGAGYQIRQAILTVIGIVLLVGLFLYLTGSSKGLIENAFTKTGAMSHNEAPSPAQYDAKPQQPSPDATGVPMDANNFFYNQE